MARFAVVERHRTASSGACGPRCACAVFYSHPRVWNEIGFPGPAYPRGYGHPGVDARERFEVADQHPPTTRCGKGADGQRPGPQRASVTLPVIWAEHVAAQGHWAGRCAST